MPHILSPNGPQQLGVPLYLKVVEGNAEFPPRSSVQQIYDQIFADLDQSIVELSTGSTPRIYKSHLDVSVVEGLKARVALNVGRYTMAAEAANVARSNYPLMSAQQLLNGFNNSNNTEFMWTSQLTTKQKDFRGISNFMSWMDPKTPGYARSAISRKITYTLYNLIVMLILESSILKVLGLI